MNTNIFPQICLHLYGTRRRVALVISKLLTSLLKFRFAGIWQQVLRQSVIKFDRWSHERLPARTAWSLPEGAICRRERRNISDRASVFARMAGRLGAGTDKSQPVTGRT